MSGILVKAEGISKKFCKSLKRSMFYGVQDIAHGIFGSLPKTDQIRPSEFWALDNISFELKRGECLGLIGPNGSGKSTLLKILNGIIAPDKGHVEIRGKVGALIEIGAGFHPMLTGRENIYVNGAILGFSKKEIDNKFDEIVNFSELGEFIDTPVKKYSSGMYVKLGFAIAAQMEPDVLLIDEVLAVGDVGFRSRCFNAINAIQKKAAVIYVSHSMPQVSRICNKILLMIKGQVFYQGNYIPQGIEVYYSNFQSETSMVSGSGRAEILSIHLISSDKHEVSGEKFSISYLDDLTIELNIRADRAIDALNVNIAFFDMELRGIAQVYSVNSNFRLVNDQETLSVKVHIDQINLNPGNYTMSLVLTDENRGETLINYHAIKNFQVTGSFIGFTPIQIRGKWSRTV